ncbi:MAG: ATP-binding cassette domain-containing protein [Planctomycetes bacterium]|nr:ATP-binding cassette domain-containing protein [Planctomycetota bacterium]MCW8137189.1 ATP-binding cassette domain-containing protein [Planctomycetota bacterium]
MPLVTISKLSMHYGGPDLLRGVSLDIEPGTKIGLIGQNGTGKSTLLKLIAGEIEATDGQVFRQRNLRLAYQTQELHAAPGATAWSEMRTLFADSINREQRLRVLEERLAKGEDLLAEYERLQHEHESSGGYDVDRRIEQVLTGLGLPQTAWHQPIQTFSGGERNIIALARIVLLEPDLMLLDEPSNHLDMDGIEWFIRFLRTTRAAVVMVSHNRHLLDTTVGEIWELHSRKITRWTGGYSDFARQKAEALALQERQYKAQQRLIKRIQFQARRLLDMARAYDDPGQAKRAKAMLMRIEQMDKIEAPDRSENRFHASLGDGRFRGHLALAIEGLTISVGAGSQVPSPESNTTDAPPGTRDTGPALARQHRTPNTEHRTLLQDTSLTIEYGQRVALVGPNGSGKTTLFNAILHHADWEHPDIDVQEGAFHIAGRLRTGKAARIGNYSQIHQHVLDEGATLIEWFMRATGLEFQPATLMLHRFLFSRDDLTRPIATLSGGEKSRLQLARLVHEQVNFLMLDEPTNHLDIQACEQLEEMLDEFEGTLLVISHDRYFLDKLVNRVVEIKDGQLVPFEGDFAKWWQKRHAQPASAGDAGNRSPERSRSDIPEGREATRRGRRGEPGPHLQSQASAAQTAKQQREDQKAHQREQHRLRTELRTLEARIEKLEVKQKELEMALAHAFSAQGQQSAEEALKLNEAFEHVRQQIQQAYHQWETLAAAIE